MNLDGQTLNIIDPVSTTEGRLAAFFIHEVQHDADQHRSGEHWEVDQPPADPGATTRAPQWTYNAYQTEFRAYWMMCPEAAPSDPFGPSTSNAVTDFNITAVWPGPDGTTGTADDVSKTMSTAFSNERQQDIFNHICAGGQANGIYWNGSDWTQSYAYLLYYYDAIASGGLPAVCVAALALDDLDRTCCQDRSQSQPFWEQARSSLAIADRYLSDSSRWPEIYRLNRDVIGPNPNHIVPGQQLRLPAM